MATKKLLASGEKFTALFAFNDISAIGAIRALEEAGLRVPADVSVLGFRRYLRGRFSQSGFDDHSPAAFRNGPAGGENGSRRIEKTDAPVPKVLSVEPTLVVRNSTAPVSK